MTEPEGPNYSIAEQLMFTTVRIETRDGDGGSGVGTGFVFEIDVAADRKALFLVTNKHVIAGAKTGTLSFTIAKDGAPSIGKRYDLKVDDFETGFTGHDDPDADVAAMPFVPI